MSEYLRRNHTEVERRSFVPTLTFVIESDKYKFLPVREATTPEAFGEWVSVVFEEMRKAGFSVTECTRLKSDLHMLLTDERGQIRWSSESVALALLYWEIVEGKKGTFILSAEPGDERTVAIALAAVGAATERVRDGS